jgi:hypothetical protein
MGGFFRWGGSFLFSELALITLPNSERGKQCATSNID